LVGQPMLRARFIVLQGIQHIAAAIGRQQGSEVPATVEGVS